MQRGKNVNFLNARRLRQRRMYKNGSKSELVVGLEAETAQNQYNSTVHPLAVSCIRASIGIKPSHLE